MKKKTNIGKMTSKYICLIVQILIKKGVAKIIAHIIFDISNIKTYSLFNCIYVGLMVRSID